MKTFLRFLTVTLISAWVFGCSPPRNAKVTSSSDSGELSTLVVDLTRGKRRTDYADESEPRYYALRRFRELGEQASPAIPVLTKLLHDARFAPEAAIALASIGPKSVTALSGGLDDGSEEVRFRSAYALGTLGEEASGALPGLRKLAQDPEETALVREHVDWAVQRISEKSAPSAK